MFRIGDFSKLSLVSIRMLRYYDDLGLLKPVQVDNFTGYRYYAASQLARLNRILALKDMGLSLEQVTNLLDQELTPKQVRGMLSSKQVELRQELQVGQERLKRITVWLEQFEEEDKMPNYEVITKKVEPTKVVEVRGVAPDWTQLGPTLDRLFDEAARSAMQQGFDPSNFGAGITTYYDTEHREQGLSVGAALPINCELPVSAPAKVYDLPGFETVACVIHNGSFSGLNGAYKAILDWIEAHGYQIEGPNREVNLEYVRGGDQSKYVTEIQFPVAKSV